jgi:hypothetical protein
MKVSPKQKCKEMKGNDSGKFPNHFFHHRKIAFSDALGHDSEKTTLIYLSTLDTSAVDNANSEILAALGEW